MPRCSFIYCLLDLVFSARIYMMKHKAWAKRPKIRSPNAGFWLALSKLLETPCGITVVTQEISYLALSSVPFTVFFGFALRKIGRPSVTKRNSFSSWSRSPYNTSVAHPSSLMPFLLFVSCAFDTSISQSACGYKVICMLPRRIQVSGDATTCW